ncbi:hypothetical protein [Metabacillus rhizolycopersici]|uniref:Alpha/beta hydrolase n=1 Tax=Metabacillus rhizolycopersici TaxID=2875709 RepID=A0ABS7UWI6_9BACI|nr:hypothetical protein [Metabacillus rhizolycopersici]MBZ5752676.1 hypothetical protein [Metabacillus rhizolycopersici]
MIIIHGRSIKPRFHIKEKMVRASLIEGIRRLDNNAAYALENNEVKVSLIYYGDILNRILVDKNPELTKRMTSIGDNWYVPDGRDTKQLEKLLSRPLNSHTKSDYQALIEKNEIIKFGDDIARAVSPILNVFGINRRVINRVLPDLGGYINSRVISSEIRERLQPTLKKALLEKDDIVLISHSMGCILAYDVLWKFSRMSEYKELWNKKVGLWLTLGCPLGEPAVKESLYDSNEPNDGMYPKNIVDWVNVSAQDDFISHDGSLNDDFHQMIDRDLIRSIKDIQQIYTFWVDSKGHCNPHKLYGYLNHPRVAEILIEWIYKSG